MLRLSVEFLHGTFHGMGADDASLTGREVAAEWPPSPARLYQALVAGGGTGDRCTSPTGVAGLALLEGRPPDILADPLDRVLESAIRDRYAVIDDSSGVGVQNYPARAAQLVRAGSRIAPANPTVEFEWSDVEPSPDQLIDLRHRAARVGYLGCADSPVRVRVETGDASPARTDRWSPDERGRYAVGVPSPGWMEVLDQAFEHWASGQPRRRSWIPTRHELYAPPTAMTPSIGGRSFWLQFDRPIRGRFVHSVAEALRGSVLDAYTRLVAGGDRSAVPAALHGHHASGSAGYDHAHWLPLPFVGREHADGRIRGACVWLPDGLDPPVYAGAHLAVGSVRGLYHSDLFDVAVALASSDGRQSATASRRRWTGPSRVWVSAFPVVHERRVKRGPSLADVAGWCRSVRLPEPIAARVIDEPLIPGAERLHPRFVFREGSERRPYSHLEIRFESAVAGPIALGRSRHFGLGLMLPVDPYVETNRRG